MLGVTTWILKGAAWGPLCAFFFLNILYKEWNKGEEREDKMGNFSGLLGIRGIDEHRVHRLGNVRTHMSKR